MPRTQLTVEDDLPKIKQFLNVVKWSRQVDLDKPNANRKTAQQQPTSDDVNVCCILARHGRPKVHAVKTPVSWLIVGRQPSIDGSQRRLIASRFKNLNNHAPNKCTRASIEHCKSSCSTDPGLHTAPSETTKLYTEMLQ